MQTKRLSILFVLWVAPFILAVPSPDPVAAQSAELGSQKVGRAFTSAPNAAEPDHETAKKPPTQARSEASIVFTREEMVDLYNNVYVPALEVKANWTGSVDACDAGDVDPAFREATRSLINMFRTMAGLPEVVFDETENAKCQKAALMFVANGRLSHSPAFSWNCYSEDGADAARSSYITLGKAGAEAVNEYMVEDRRWLLFPRQIAMGSGSTTHTVVVDTDPTTAGTTLEEYPGSHALWVTGPFGERPASPEWVIWPPPGYIPRDLVFDKWTIARNIPGGADFTSATVEVSVEGKDLPVTRNVLQDGRGDNTLSFEPQGFNFRRVLSDTNVKVTVGSIEVGGEMTTHTYSVSVIQLDFLPAQASDWPLY